MADFSVKLIECTDLDCDEAGTHVVVMMGRDSAPFCQPHADELLATVGG